MSTRHTRNKMYLAKNKIDTPAQCDGIFSRPFPGSASIKQSKSAHDHDLNGRADVRLPALPTKMSRAFPIKEREKCEKLIYCRKSLFFLLLVFTDDQHLFCLELVKKK